MSHTLLITLTFVAIGIVAYGSFVVSRDIALLESAQKYETCIQAVYGMTVEECRDGNNNQYCVCQ